MVDLDLDRIFERVNHDMLMARSGRRVQDNRVLKLFRAYLNAAVIVNGVVLETAEGTPQGGPVRPLLANIPLDDPDRELERQGHRFVRYADDGNIIRPDPTGGAAGAGRRNALDRDGDHVALC